MGIQQIKSRIKQINKLSKIQLDFVNYEKNMEEKRVIHLQHVYFKSIVQITTWTLIVMVAFTLTINTPDNIVDLLSHISHLRLTIVSWFKLEFS